MKIIVFLLNHCWHHTTYSYLCCTEMIQRVLFWKDITWTSVKNISIFMFSKMAELFLCSCFLCQKTQQFIYIYHNWHKYKSVAYFKGEVGLCGSAVVSEKSAWMAHLGLKVSDPWDLMRNLGQLMSKQEESKATAFDWDRDPSLHVDFHAFEAHSELQLRPSGINQLKIKPATPSCFIYLQGGCTEVSV